MQSEQGRPPVDGWQQGPSPSPLAEGPLIRDPFAHWEASPASVPAETRSSRLGTLALGLGASALLLGPLTGVAAVVVAALAWTRDPAHRSRAIVGLLAGATLSLAWPLVLFLALQGGLDVAGRRVAARPAEGPAAPALGVPATPPVQRLDPSGTVPQRTLERPEGSIVVVEMGVQEPSLADALREQRAAADRAGQTLLLTTTRSGCEPCEGLVASLPDPLMQAALADVRLVRIDIDVFGEDLQALRLPSDTIPGFFLLDADLSLRDAIHGGEWGLDVARNIAPVLGPFVRGTLEHRKYVFAVPPGRKPPPPPPPASGGTWL